MNFLEIAEIPITKIRKVGEKRAMLLNKKGIYNLRDLLMFYPREYEDRRTITKISDANTNDIVVLNCIAQSIVTESRIRPGLTISKLLLKDNSGTITSVWFNQPYIKRNIRIGDRLSLYGKVITNYNSKEIQNPEYEILKGTEYIPRIQPIYSLSEGLSQKIIKSAVEEAFNYCGEIEDYMPERIKEYYNLSDLSFALRQIHFPDSEENNIKARTRLVFDELLLLQLSLFRVRNELKESELGICFNPYSMENFISRLPFKLTDAQLNVYREIERDMESSKVMNRLVQGDVGSGKTIVAVMAMLKAVKSGYQAAYMAPTEILAEQHFNSLTNFLKDESINIVMLKGSQTRKVRNDALERIKLGMADIVVGTHALIQDGVEFSNLGLVITDEQHRFGVKQRAALSGKAVNIPDVLVMTATPIPRTLALILYGDLDISIIDKVPEGRKPVKTFAVNEAMRPRIYNFIRKIVNQGHQVYIVCPAVEESEALDIKAVTEHYEELSKGAFSDLKVGLLHGKMKISDKDSIMQDFKNGLIQILVATTVIEVGVDVPNSTLMVIENAERFGLSQLHQLRGRVGRGSSESFCVLFNQSSSDISKERMKIMVQTSNGFEISEKDLQIRGPGEFFGTKQHGLPVLRLANLYEDMDILKNAQKACGQILEYDPQLTSPENKYLSLLSIKDEFVI